MRRRRAFPVPLLLLVLTTVLSLGAGVIALGPPRAVRIAGAAVLNVMIDGLAEQLQAHRIPVVEVEVAPDALDSLNADLPWSGADAREATVVHNGIRYPAKYRYRGLVITTHYLGGKKSFRLNLKKNNPFEPYRRLNFLNPKTNDFLKCHLGYWIAGRMGVAVPYDELVFVRLNGADHGVHEMLEQIDGRFERSRHLVDSDVPVFKGDHPPAQGRDWPAGRALWRDAKHWTYVSKADSLAAIGRLEKLVRAINDTGISDRARADSLAALVDVDAYVRFCAALKVMHTMHIDNRHNQWLVLSPRSHRFYPVMWDPMPLFAINDPFYPIHDALEYWLMKDPALRLRRDRYIHAALQELVEDSAFDRHLEALEDRILPSVLADRNKYGQVTEYAQDVVRFSALNWAGACTRLRSGIHAYWTTLAERMRVADFHIRREGDMLIATWNSDAVIGYRVLTDSLVARPLGMDASIVQWQNPADGRNGVDVMPEYPVTHSKGEKGDPYQDSQYWITPRELRIALNGTDPAAISFVDLITDETIATAN